MPTPTCIIVRRSRSIRNTRRACNISACWRTRRAQRSAVDLIGKAIALEPKDPQSRYNIALALRALGRNEDAIVHLRRAVGLKADFAEAHLHLGIALADAGDAAAAADCYGRVLQLEPRAAEAHFRLAELHAAEGRHDEAVAGYERALSLKGDHAPAHNALGTLLIGIGRAADAVAHFQQAIRSDPRLTDAYLNLGRALLRHGKLDDALGVINRTFELGLRKRARADGLDLVQQALATRGERRYAHIVRSMRARLRTVPTRAESVPDDPCADRAMGPEGRLVGRGDEPVVRTKGRSATASRAPPRHGRGGFRRPNCTDHRARRGHAGRLLRSLLQSACIRDIALERFLTDARLFCGGVLPKPRPMRMLAFACALACQCFINEYAFACTDAEQARSRRLRDVPVRDIAP